MWTQQYDPLGIWVISTLVAALPVLVLLGLLATGRASAWKAALYGLLTACAWRSARVWDAGADDDRRPQRWASVFAVFRIVWLIVAAVFLYDITVATGQFEIMKASVARLSADRRLQAVLVAFCFGAFIEGAAGFGAPVAISAAFLVGLGFQPFQGGLALLDRQHRTRGLGRHRHPHPDAEQGHRAGCPRLERHVRQNLADHVADDSVLAGSHHDDLARDAGRLVSATRHRRNVCLGSIPLVELCRLRAGRHRLVGCQHGGGSDRDPVLASRAALAV